MVLLGGRIAEEVMFGVSITSGASKDIEEAYMLAEQMIMKFGMGRKTVYTHQSENAKTFIDKDIEMLIENSYCRAREIVLNARLIIDDASDLLVKKKTLQVSDIVDIIQKYNLKIPIA
jgi:ATP-dependent Zn protease